MSGHLSLSQLIQSTLAAHPEFAAKLSNLFRPQIESTGDIEADIAAYEQAHPPNAVQRFMSTPLSQLLGVPIQTPQIPGTYDYTQLTGKPSPAQPLANWMTEVADKQMATPGGMAMAIPMSLKSESGYVYHATNRERMGEIAKSGLKTHKPWEFTDQDTWPDGSTGPRNYFSRKADIVWQFAPEGGEPMILRVKEQSHPFRRESTGDVFSTKTVPAKDIEYLDDDAVWKPLK